MYGSMYVCLAYAFRYYSMYAAETWHGGRGQGLKVWEQLCEATPPKVKGQSRGQVGVALEMFYGY